MTCPECHGRGLIDVVFNGDINRERTILCDICDGHGRAEAVADPRDQWDTWAEWKGER